jgi:hypothetical protein
MNNNNIHIFAYIYVIQYGVQFIACLVGVQFIAPAWQIIACFAMVVANYAALRGIGISI